MASKLSVSIKKVAGKDEQAIRVPAVITTSADRVLAVTKQLQGQLACIGNNPRVQVIAVSAGGSGATLAFAGGTVGGAVGGATGAAVGVVPAIFTFGLSIPAGFVVGGTVGTSTGVVVGGGTGLVGGGMAGSVAYAYRVQINDGKVYITAKVKDISNKAQMKGIQAKRAVGKNTHELACTVSTNLKKSQDAVFGKNGKLPRLRDEVRNITSQTKFQVAAASAAGGATVGGAGGGAVGLTAGAVVGGAMGVVPALFTFGLSIPIGAAIGGGTGLCIGAAAGSSAGAVTGGAAGYGAYTKRDTIRAAFKSTENKACDMYGFAKEKGKVVQKKIQGNTGGTSA